MFTCTLVMQYWEKQVYMIQSVRLVSFHEHEIKHVAYRGVRSSTAVKTSSSPRPEHNHGK